MTAAKALPKRKRATKRISLKLDTSRGANQSDAPAADINTIVAQYKKHGTIPNVGLKNPLYGDFTFPENLTDIREAIYVAEDRFNELPADVRTAAKNDMGEFLEMFNDPDRQKLLEDAGLIISENPEIKPPAPKPESPKTPDESPTSDE